jgi:hypothetical protein
MHYEAIVCCVSSSYYMFVDELDVQLRCHYRLEVHGQLTGLSTNVQEMTVDRLLSNVVANAGRIDRELMHRNRPTFCLGVAQIRLATYRQRIVGLDSVVTATYLQQQQQQ